MSGANYSVFSGENIPAIEKRYEGQGYGTFKKELAEVVIEKLTPIQEKYREIVHSSEVDQILKDGAERATAAAERTLTKVKQAMGFVTF
ncbi:hypothetical protein ABDI30_21480 [Paenibacillus cisolokensis]|uniref:hypothetical protein n=1 Tax=Paenibacillus cisolokensis TaxID=1658519 RepID=UPI003D2CCA55